MWPPYLKKLLPPEPDQLFLLTTLGMPFKPPLQPSTREYCLVKRDIASVVLARCFGVTTRPSGSCAPGYPTNLKTWSQSHPLFCFDRSLCVGEVRFAKLWVINCQHPNFNTPVEPSQNKGFPRLLTSSHHGSPRLQSRSRDPSMSHSLRALTSIRLQQITEVSLTEERNVAANSCQTSHHDNSGESVSV